MALNISALPLATKVLHMPSLEELKKVIDSGLGDNYRESSVEIVACPNLEEAPFNLAGKGLEGKTKAVDLGGTPYLLPLPHREKLYDLRNIAQCLNMDTAFVIGGGCGPFPFCGSNGEGIFNFKVESGKITQKSSMALVQPNGEYALRFLPPNETRCALLGNFYVSQGKPGKVLKIQVKNRKGPYDFPASIRTVLRHHYQQNVVGLGGVFLTTKGKVKHHIMSDFSPVALYTDADINNWLNFYDFEPPCTSFGYLITADPNLDARKQHFHSVGNFKKNEGGHYLIDTTPELVEYVGYFNTIESVVRIDRPTTTHQVVGAIYSADEENK